MLRLEAVTSTSVSVRRTPGTDTASPPRSARTPGTDAETPQEQRSGTERVLAARTKVSIALARLERLFDPGTLEVIGAEVTHRAEGFGLEKRRIPGDGVVTASGLVEGRPVFAYAQDRTVLGGSLGQAHAQKIARLQDLALRAGAPFVGINDSGGARIQEGVDALGGYGEIFRRNVAASGVIPQISVIAGPCAGGAVYSPALTDFVGMVDRSSFMFLTGPKVVKTVTFEDVTVEELGGARTHAERTGVSHFRWGNDEEAIAQVRRLLSYLPSNHREEPPFVAPTDDVERMDAALGTIVPGDPRKPYDVRAVVELVVDRDSFMEVQAGWARNVVVGLGRLGGHVIGIIANQPLVKAGVLDIDASRKAARFIRTCNAFGIPLVSLVDVPGFLPGREQEYGGVIDHGAKLLYAYCEATVPKLAVILRKAYGGAYIVMSSQHVGGDVNLAWPRAEIAVMGASGAVEVLNRRELAAAEDPEGRAAELRADYEERFLNPDIAAQRGYIDAVIEPCETRRRLYRHLRVLLNKREWTLPRRHANGPL
ncbi:methylmalonyl-CoA carboxyltransferase [Lujinxingia litoralis]|uniref:Methylmalonyl-CoA carboxyltransferase n=2 Tax=Lujinxingia litoralis TaxID=2211119 RepID=A0A328CCT9_9DELT|nr:methylmalonyl-CoA carboxyltransferase [Lujinxingia litoralis]